MITRTRRRTVVDDSALANRIGGRLRSARKLAGLTQQQLAEGRYTKAYISALEKGNAKPSMAALDFLCHRLGLPASHFLAEDDVKWSRIEADIMLASGSWQAAADAYGAILAGPLDRAMRAESLRGMAEAFCRLERGSEAIGSATEALESFKALKRDRDAALATYWLAYAQHLSGNTAEARALLSGLLARLRVIDDGDHDLRMRLLMALSSLDAGEEQHRSALGYLEEARAMGRDLDDRRRAAFLSMLAQSYMETGDLEAAIRTGVESLGLFRAAEAQHEAAILENNLALAYVRVGNLSRARGYAAQARIRHTAESDRRSLAHVADTEAQIALADDDMDAALQLADEALVHAEASGNHRAEVSAQLTHARTHLALDDPETAMRWYERATSVMRSHGPRNRVKEALGEWADVLASLGRHEEAYALMREALEADVAPPITLPEGDSSDRPVFALPRTEPA